jgi:uncharacterized protein YjbI with pentapeptide repeats
MQEQSFYDQRFEGEAIDQLFKAGQHFEACQFIKCDLKKATLSQIKFTDCHFEDCNLEGCYIVDTAFQEVSFKESRLLGLEFEHCSRMLFSIRFEKSKLSVCSFNGLDLRDCRFSESELREVDFSNTDCQDVTFDGCDLGRSIFEQSDLRKADFRAAIGFNIDPEKNKLQGAHFLRASIDGLLSKYGLELD